MRQSVQQRPGASLRAFAVVAALVAAACGAPTGKPCAGDEQCAAGEVCSAGACHAPLIPQDGGPTTHRVVALEVTAAQPTLAPGDAVRVSAQATFDDGATGAVGGSVTWKLTPSGLARVEVRSAQANDVALVGLAVGTVQLSAAIGDVSSAPVIFDISLGAGDGGRADGGAPDGGSGDGGQGDAGRPDAGPPPDGGPVGDGGRPLSAGEVRAVWVTRFAYTSAADVRGVIGRAADAGVNVVFFQIRGAGDAYYHSTLEPWAKGLTGTLGQDPGWDPLQVAIDEAHARGLQLHAYFNVFSGWACASSGTCACKATGAQATCTLPEASAAGAPTHWLRAHPDSMAVDSTGANQDTEYYWFSPADVAYRAHVVAVATELLQTYAVDGLHLDRVRYPGAWSSYDATSLANAPAGATARADWQRAQVSAMVSDLYQAVKTVRPQAMLSASVWGIHTRLPGCSTSEGNTQYFQDSIGWIDQARLDWIVPMIYWDLGTGCTDFGRLLATFTGTTRQARVVAGMLSDTAAAQTQAKGRIRFAQDAGVAGSCLFSSTGLDTAGGWSALHATGAPWAVDAGVPAQTWR